MNCIRAMSGDHKTVIKGNPSQYVKLNIGGSLHYTTIGTLTKHDTMLRAMFSGRMEVLTDSEGEKMHDSRRRDGEGYLKFCKKRMNQTCQIVFCQMHNTWLVGFIFLDFIFRTCVVKLFPHYFCFPQVGF